MEFVLIGVIIFFVMAYNNIISVNKFVQDNQNYFKGLQEKDYEFYARSKYGDDVKIEVLFQQRLKIGLITIVIFLFMFITNINFLNIIGSLLAGYVMFKINYMSAKKFYKAHLNEINLLLPYYLKTIEVLIQHYTVPVALGKSIDSAPDIFRPGLQDLIDKINAGDSSINPYMEFANTYPVRDSMRMMRLLYRLGLGKQENKEEQLLLFSRTVSSLQNKSREQKYKERLKFMENRTLYMLVITGGGVMALLIMSMTVFLAI